LSRAAPPERRHDRAGFTVIEGLVALAVLAAALAAIGSVVATSARGTRRIEAHLALVETARAIATGLPKRDELAPGTLAGELAGHNWRVDVLPFADPTSGSAWVPQTVVITVRAPGGGALRIDTVRLRRRPRE
jgi:general secretion pathway protein I